MNQCRFTSVINTVNLACQDTSVVVPGCVSRRVAAPLPNHGQLFWSLHCIVNVFFYIELTHWIINKYTQSAGGMQQVPTRHSRRGHQQSTSKDAPNTLIERHTCATAGLGREHARTIVHKTCAGIREGNTKRISHPQKHSAKEHRHHQWPNKPVYCAHLLHVTKK